MDLIAIAKHSNNVAIEKLIDNPKNHDALTVYILTDLFLQQKLKNEFETAQEEQGNNINTCLSIDQNTSEFKRIMASLDFNKQRNNLLNIFDELLDAFFVLYPHQYNIIIKKLKEL